MKPIAPGIRRLAAEGTALPPEITPAGTRKQVLDAALLLFAERGYAGASIRDVAKAAGVQSATLYAHYPSKEHVLAEIVEIGHREHHRVIRQALMESGSDPGDQLTAWVSAHVRFHASYSMLAVVANAELHMLSPELGARAFELRRQSVEILEEIIARGIERGGFDVPHPWLAAAAIGGMGLRVAHWYTPEFELPLDAVAEGYAELARRIVGNRD